MTASEIPESRDYRHARCGMQTSVDGEDFEVISDPLSGIDKIYCPLCADVFHRSEFTWQDTGELISDYCQRHSAGATLIERFICSRGLFFASMFVGLVCGLVVGYYLYRDDDIGWFWFIFMIIFTGGVGLIVIGSLKEFLLARLVKRRVFGVWDTRLLK